MPTYDYACPKCKVTYEVREGFDAPITQKCQECGKGTAKRVLTAPRIVFKGSGWYATDSRSKTTVVADTPSEGGSSDAKGESKTESKAEGKAETKSEGGAKTESKPAKSESKSESKPSGPKSSSGDPAASAAS